ncbi:MAG TPA: diguanylate cyclase [Chloroflexota bacterium]
MSADTLEHLFATLCAVASATRVTTPAALLADVGEIVMRIPGVTASAWYLRDASQLVVQDYRSVERDSIPHLSSAEIDEWTEPHIVQLNSPAQTGDDSSETGDALTGVLWLGVPLAGAVKTYGVLLVRLEHLGNDGSSQSATLASLGKQVGVALEGMELRQEVERLSPIDRATGVFSREYFDRMLHSEVERASRLRYPLGLLLLEPDAVERIQVDYGQGAQASVLLGVAEAISPAVRAIDTVFRVDTNAFAVLLPGATASGLRGVAERLRVLVARTQMQIGPRQESTTLSLGGAVFPSEAYDADELMEVSRKALTASKDSGRDRVTVLDNIL